MADSFFSPHWYKVSDLKLKLKSRVRLVRHVYRGQIWYVLVDKLSNDYHRFNEHSYYVISLLDGKRTLQEVWQLAIQAFKDEAPSQAEIVELLGRLYVVDALLSDRPADARELFERHSDKKKQKWKSIFSSPLAIKVPLLDPDRFLSQYGGPFRHLFSLPGMLFWLLLLIVTLSIVGTHWRDLTLNLRDTVLTPENLLYLAILFPVVKALHELGHAMAIKSWGGEVHEIGVMFLVFIPVPYVDASASTAFKEKSRRLIVGAAGMMVELAVAAVALIFWVVLDDGVAKTLAYNIVLIAGVTTLFFNANPLLKFDGYYILADLIEIPNLYSRAQKYIEYLVKKYVAKDAQVVSPISASGESPWLFLYAVFSWFYRLFIVLIIALFVAKKYFFIGVLIACWSLYNMLFKPIVSMVLYWLNFNIARNVTQSNAIVIGCGGLVLLGLLLPLPHYTSAVGLLSLPDKYALRSGSDCFVDTVNVSARQRVAQGDLILSCQDSFLLADITQKIAERESSEIKFLDALKSDPFEAALLQKRLEIDTADIMRIKEKEGDLRIVAGYPGEIFLSNLNDLPGKFLQKGDLLGYILSDDIIIRAVIDQKDVDYIRNNTLKVEYRRAGQLDAVAPARLISETPQASNSLPNKALGIHGGGNLAVNPMDVEGVKTFDNYFQYDIKPETPIHPVRVNERVYLRFYHDNKPLISRWIKGIRLFFMDEFNV